MKFILAGFPVQAVQMRPAPGKRLAACGAFIGRFDGLARHAVLHAAQDFGNHVVGAANPHRAAQCQLFALNVPGVIEGRLLHGHPSEVHR